jgi:hypothetical protein
MCPPALLKFLYIQVHYIAWVFHIVASHFQRMDHTLHTPVRQTIKALSFCEVPHTEYLRNVVLNIDTWV